ncbi:hypothetical protein AAFC00_003458 [Neodothiora populina]|uniref:Filamentation protein n=1 Tax=Neodothiora populina TaxID=2781224 RepID=A0ABR3PEA9_9PEZI
MSVIESEKALRYIGLLDNARLNAKWGEIPELTRKVDKHAPHRKCLTLTANSEAAVANAARDRPSTASSTSSQFSALLDVTPNLIQAVDQEKTHFEDAFQANVCLHEIYFLRGEWKTITGGLHDDVWQQLRQHSKNPLDISPNTRLAILKNSYFLGIAYEKEGDDSAAAQSYQSALKAVQNPPANVASATEFRIWAERLLGRASLLVTGNDSPTTLPQANTALVAYRNWADYWDQVAGKTTSVTVHTHSEFDLPRREVWSRYYKLLSFILAAGLIYSSSATEPLTFPTEDVTMEQLTSARVQQRTEMKRVEMAYETLLLQETHFPKASQSNHEVENWVQQAIGNWQIFCGSRWREADLGEGGKAAVGRSMLDILYRAATKTFHSTPILRSLFNVHASLAEFDLAMRAFDTYSDIITKGKSRAEKTGEHEIGLDSDDVVILTATQAMALLCKYGSRTEAEKALGISKTLTTWLHQNRPSSSGSTTLERTTTESLLSRSASAAAYRAIGQAQSNWARLTYEPTQRKELQVKALGALRRSAELATPPGSDPETAVLLATVLAETRDYIAAIQVVKKALATAPQSRDSDTDSIAGAPEAQDHEQKVAPLWHLLSLLLTARGEYDNAVKISEAAFEQLNGPDFFASEASQGGSPPATPTTQALIDHMGDSVKESLIQIRITQLALVEILENPAAAADASSSLLALYHKLFGAMNTNPAPAPEKPAASLLAPAPPVRASTIKSISGSIMGRRGGRRSLEKNTFDKPAAPSVVGTEASTIGAPVSIQITNEDGHPAEKHHHHPHLPVHPFKLRGHHNATDSNPQTNTNRNTLSEKNGTDASTEQALRQIPHNMDHHSAPLGHSDQPPGQDLRLPAPHPSSSYTSVPSLFPAAQARRHRMSLLIDIWLFIAGQYARSELYEDAEGAIDEAEKLTEVFLQEFAKEDCSASGFDERGWGGGKSVNRLWADVHAKRANLAIALGHPHEALSLYEQSLSSYPDHPVATVGISALLLDIYEENMTPEPPSAYGMPEQPTAQSQEQQHSPSTPSDKPNGDDTAAAVAASNGQTHGANISSTPPQSSRPSSTAPTGAPPSPALLNRLAARDRAHMLLSTQSKLGSGWDDSETWLALARAHELAGQMDRAKECLWWVVELEDSRPVRPWDVVSGSVV